MALAYNRHELKIQQIFNDFNDGVLIVDTSYQRRSVWLDRDKVRLIETILMGLIIPEVYFWDAETDPDTGKTITHIVDGQQRIKAIAQFINNEFKLSKDFLIDQEISEKYGNKYFRDLGNDDKILIWTFNLSVVRIKDKNMDEIRNIFYRLNLTDYSLNDQEKRHSNTWGLFADLTKEISELSFWDDFNLFNYGDIKRMKDEEFCSSLILLARKGIINQTNQNPLNDAYSDYATNYPEYNDDKNRILKWIDTFKQFYSQENKSFIRKRTQLYTIFCLMDYLTEEKIEVTSHMISRFNNFVQKYNLFENSSDTEEMSNPEDEAIKKYKLASSEGVNKIRNRKLRYEILKNYVMDLTV
ncbi:DUF262 domain-containing protein [Parabacteroides johnsonii]|jgi:hypothetical protein|uniref:DUF262 domain-containing protein n=1 Tax=Parabacteroides johnsonii TaxID=387661 RepID=UPI00265D0DF5|nr:DUF262 domain-containing protein [Parabacteroides johnsonii]